MLMFPPEGELLILVCLLLLPALSASAGLPLKLGKYDDEYRTEIHDTAGNGTNLIEVGSPIGLNVTGLRRSTLRRVKPVNCTRNIRDGVIGDNSAEQAVSSGVNFTNGRNLARTNEIWNGYFESNFFGGNVSKVETNGTGQMYANRVKVTEKKLEFSSGAKSIKSNTLIKKSRRSVVDQANSAAVFPMAEVAKAGNTLLEAKPTTAADGAVDAETLAVTMTTSVYESGNTGDVADYYDEGDDYGEDYNEGNNSGDGNYLGEDDNSGDRDDIDIGNNSGDTIESDNSGARDTIDGDNSGDRGTIDGDNSGDRDTIDGDNSGDGENSGDNGDNDGSGEGLEGCGDYDYDNYDYDYDKDEVEDVGDDSKGLLGIGDLGGDFDSLEKIFPQHFIKMLLEKYYRTQQMMMTINIFETKEFEEYES